MFASWQSFTSAIRYAFGLFNFKLVLMMMELRIWIRAMFLLRVSEKNPIYILSFGRMLPTVDSIGLLRTLNFNINSILVLHFHLIQKVGKQSVSA